MKKIDNIHATCVAINQNGILILGVSGAGKSDMALRLIENKNAFLVSDDRTDILCNENKIYAKAPDIIKGLLEVRGVGVVNVQCIDNCEVKLVVNLADNLAQIERMPVEKFYEINNVKIPMINLYPFEISAIDKVVIKLKASLEN